jgi:hypothetical protein
VKRSIAATKQLTAVAGDVDFSVLVQIDQKYDRKYTRVSPTTLPAPTFPQFAVFC